uniref:Desmoglein 2 n=1 Tax=Leptobrachium leishanense TaxID=445787 RepID=A0A8C5M9X8_9ANUR
MSHKRRCGVCLCSSMGGRRGEHFVLPESVNMAWIPGGGGGRLLVLMVIFHLGQSLHVEVLKRGVKSEYRSLVRHKREWIIPPVSIREEEDNSYKNPIAKIQSDLQVKGLRYVITGMGITEPPLGIFIIDESTGFMSVTGIVDREQTPMFYLKGYALDQNGKDVEPPIELRVRVLDINDNAPVFTFDMFNGEIEELSVANSLVLKMSATDADDPLTDNARLAYRIISQEPATSPRFLMIKETGEVRTTSAIIDREQQSSYKLVVEVKDLAGAAGAMSGTATMNIKVKDVNDNVPFLEYEAYEGSVEENLANVEILRMKAIDFDEEFSDNWLANFTIISGNEGGYFEIIRDPLTNEGILMMVKEADYEVMQNAELKVVVSNQAAYHYSVTGGGAGSGVIVGGGGAGGGAGAGGGGGAGAGGGGGGGGMAMGKSIPIKVKVKNVAEGPVFRPRRKSLMIREGKSVILNQIIGSYQATDGDTGQIASNVKYAKEYDPDNWFTIDPVTAEIKLSKIPDRESLYVVNGTYVAKILAISETLPGKTATGTIAIEVEDENDNCPTLVEPTQTVCDSAPFINVTAVDLDAYPNGSPFKFTVVDEPVGFAKLWTIGEKNDVSVQLVPKETWPGIHKIQILVKDNQGMACPTYQVLQLTVCSCGGGSACTERRVQSSAQLGPAAVGLMALAGVLLLLSPILLLVSYCGSGGKGFMAIPDGTEASILTSNNEGAEPLNMAMLPGIVSAGDLPGVVGAGRFEGFQGESFEKAVNYGTNMMEKRWEEHRGLLASAEGGAFGSRTVGVVGSGSGSGAGAGGGFGLAAAGGGYSASGAGGMLNEEFIKGYFTDKAIGFADDEDAQPAKDCILVYSQETESVAGSVGCCSFIESEFDEECLDNLGVKFKALADVCQGMQERSSVQVEKYKSYEELRQNTYEAEAEFDLAAAQEEEATFVENSYTASASEVHHAAQQEMAMREEVIGDQHYTSAVYVQEPMVRGNVLVTEKSYTTMPALRLEPLHQQNLLVTERVIRPAASMHKIIDIADGQNVMVSGRMITSDQAVSGLVETAERPDSQYLLVTERVIAPGSGITTSRSAPDMSIGQNMLVTERHFTPISNVKGNVLVTSERSGGQSIMENIAVTDGGMQGQVHFNQGGYLVEDLPPSTNNVSKSASRVAKYSTVQYTRS